MTENEQILSLFQARLTQLLLRFRQLEMENADLRAKIDAKDRIVEKLQDDFARKCSDYDILKTAKVLSVSDTDIERTKERLASMIRDVNKCIAVLKQ